MATSLSHGLSHAPVRCQHSLPHSRTSCLVTRHTPSHYITLWPLGAIQGHQHTTIHYLYPAQHILCVGSVLFELRTYVTLSDLLPVYNIIQSDIKPKEVNVHIILTQLNNLNSTFHNNTFEGSWYFHNACIWYSLLMTFLWCVMLRKCYAKSSREATCDKSRVVQRVSNQGVKI